MPKAQKTIFLILLFIFLFFGSKALAAACNKPPAWNTAGSCTLDIYYEDPSGGSNLAGCYYNIQSGVSPTCPSNGAWNSACNCSGLASITCPVPVSIGPTGNCNTNGAGACKACSKATDGAGNVSYGEQSLNIDFAAPTVTVTGAPASWQNTDATASVICTDPYSGCDATTYKLKTYTTNPGTCSTNYADYTLTPSQTISSHLWVCGAAKDNVGNPGFSSPVEFKVDKEKPISQITAPPAGSDVTADFNVTVTDTDTGGSGINTSACYYRTYDSGVGWTRAWTLRTCNSTQLITVGSGKDCQTENGTCTVYVYSYDNAGNQSDTNLRSFLIRIDITPPTITINTSSGLWYKENPLLDVDFSDDKALDDGFYQVDSFVGAWTAIFTDNPGTSYTTDFRIADATWNDFADGSSHTIYFKATDDAGNQTGQDGSKSLVIKKDVSAPAVSVTGAPASWQNTDATASVICTDPYSGCDSATYKLKTYTTNPGACSTNYADYTLTPPQTISSHLWVCGAAKDLVGNAGFSSSVEFKVDKEKPVSLITAPEAGSTQTADFNVSVSDTDTGGSGINTSACYYRTYDSGVGYTRAWTLRTCNSTQLITVGEGKDCQTIGGACTVYVYSYDNAGNQSDINLRSFTIESITCSVSVPNSGLVNQWIEINVSGSQGTITGVRFAGDNVLNGIREGNWDPPEPNYYDWNTSSGNWLATTKTMKWSFVSAGNYEVWAEVKDGAGNTRACYDTILIMECYPGQTKTCTSPQGCSHTLTCQADGTWPSCPTDTCTANTPDSPNCPCPGIDGCVGNDYYDYPAYGDCNSYCSCDVGTSPGQPCAPTIYTNDPRCVGADQCNSDADCEDGNPCTNNWCERPADPDSVCRRDNLAEGVSCGICKQCDGNGNCVNRPDGYDSSECGTGCQRCIYGFCQDYSLACEGSEASCECRSDFCIDCSDYYDGGCGYQGVCYCGFLEKPVWSCSDWKCQCTCQYDAECEEVGECQRASPQVVLDPLSKSGNPGDTLTYDVSVINSDLNCDPSTFSLTKGEACNISGWACTLAQNSLTIDAGQSGLTTLSVTSATGIPGGDYDVSVTATNSGAGLGIYFGTGFAKYNVFNQPPYKPTPSDGNGVSWDHCSVKALSIPTFHWTYSDPENNPQKFYEIQINNNTDFSAPKFTYLGESTVQSGEEGSFAPSPSQINSWLADWMDWGDVLYWRVRVNDREKDSGADPDYWSDWLEPTEFTFSTHAGPWPDFTPSPSRVSLNQVVTFEDNSKCYTFPGNVEFNCRDLVPPSYEWDFDYIEPAFTVDDTTKGNATTAYGDLGNYKVKLRITDDIDACFSETENLTVTLPLPEWREIPPF